MTEFESVSHIPVVQEDPDSKTTIIVEESAVTDVLPVSVSITGANSGDVLANTDIDNNSNISDGDNDHLDNTTAIDYTLLMDHAVDSTLVLAPVASPTESAVAAAATVSWLVNRASDQPVIRSEFVAQRNRGVDGTFETLEVNSTNDSIALDRPRQL